MRDTKRQWDDHAEAILARRGSHTPLLRLSDRPCRLKDLKDLKDLRLAKPTESFEIEGYSAEIG